MALLKIKNLSVDFKTNSGWFRAVDRVSLNIEPAQVHAIVGESGSGKSVAMLAVMGLLPKTARVMADVLQFEQHDLLTMDAKQRRKIIGKDMAMIFQEPATSLNPCFTIGFQLMKRLKRIWVWINPLGKSGPLNCYRWSVFLLRKNASQISHIKCRAA